MEIERQTDRKRDLQRLMGETQKQTEKQKVTHTHKGL